MADKPPPPQQGYPPQQQYPPTQQGYPPPQNPPPQQGYPPQQYPPPQGGYPPQQGYPPPSGTSPQQVPMTQVVIRDPQNRADDHLVFAVLVTIFCCWPVGIVAIIKSLNVRRLNDREDYTSAQQASQEARKWCIITLVCGIVLEVIAFIFVILHFTVFAVTATVTTKTTIDYVNNAFDDFDQDHQGHDWDLPESDNFPGDSFWG